MSSVSNWLEPAFIAAAIGDEGRACRDIPDSACAEEPRNYFTHVGALALSKTADGLVDPKLVLSWLLTTTGAPAGLVGLLVPIREAGALLPQLFTAGALRQLPRRKWAWASGAVVQGLAALAMAIAALTLTGAALGWAVIAALAVLALARSVCSVCYKDVLGKTVAKARRGSATGLASSAAATTVILYALLLAWPGLDRFTLVVAGLCVASGAWIAGAALFATLAEASGATGGGQTAIRAAIDNLSYLRSDGQLRRFIATRALLTATALAPPFMVAAGAGAGSDGYGALGLLVLASALASLVSSFVWGRLSDRSSRRVLVYAAIGGSLATGATAALALAGALAVPLVLAALLFALMIAYQGVRLGRSTHLVDMASEETRAAYTALSNTIIGLILLAGGAFSLLASVAGPATVLAVMAGLCALAVPAAMGLEEVQDR